MWPKVFAQLVELLPHISRLIPMADVFFQTKSTSEKAGEAALSALSRDVRTDLGKVTAAHDSLYSELQAHTAHLADIASDSSYTRAAIENLGDRLSAQDRQIAALRTWIVAVVALLIVVLGLSAAVLIRAR